MRIRSMARVMNCWGANHGAISYGHIGADIITLCSTLRIPVCMHNVEEKDIFRPAAWNAFAMDKESADYRACENFGPLYNREEDNSDFIIEPGTGDIIVKESVDAINRMF